MEQQHMPFHATILTGAPEARHRRGLELAQELVCSAPEGTRKPCGVCRDCRKAAEGIHPDVIPVERFMEEKDIGREIKIGPIRALRSDAFIRPNEAARKVYLIDNAQNLNLNAQNALLKLLEEGPAYAAFLLMCDRSGALLETIRSRCALVRLEEGAPPEDPDAAAFARLLGGKEGDELARCAFLARLELEKPDRQRLEEFLTALAALLDDAVLGGVTGQFQCPESAALAARLGRAQLLEWAGRCRRGLEMLPFHVGAGHLLGWLGAGL